MLRRVVQVLTVWNVACGVFVTLFAAPFLVVDELPFEVPDLWITLASPLVLGWVFGIPFTTLVALIANRWARWRPAKLFNLFLLVLWLPSMCGMTWLEHRPHRHGQVER
ncbi:MAG: hypothetical protein H6739_36805 [Alphaproteobacteria bacterium]|nr:hypothetical protein [Alphaproteobacteria bacterium]